MNAIVFPFGDAKTDAPPAGGTREVAPGVHWIRMPLPFALDHINLWLLEDGDGLVIVDCGLALDSSKDFWRQILGGHGAGPDAGQGARRIHRLVVTHFHPDHIGLAGWLAEWLDAELWITRTEWLMARMLYLDTAASNHEHHARFYRMHGMPQGAAEKMFTGGNTYRARVTEPPVLHRRLQAGDTIAIGGRAWQIIVGTGHAPEHACLYSDELRVLISGDQILPKITPNISVWASEPDANPLDDYLGSLDQFRALPADTLVLPSHNLPFRGLHRRLDELRHHHDERLDRLRNAPVPPGGMSAADAVPILFRRELDTHQFGFAMGEALAHLAYLEGSAEMRAESGADGVVRFIPKS
jgi:glyoxylase-like metal-dependent hydrolase (beta-lactamase superfamily II)